jgi:hypothetical protein
MKLGARMSLYVLYNFYNRPFGRTLNSVDVHLTAKAACCCLAVEGREALNRLFQHLEHDPEKWTPVFPRDKGGTHLRGDHAQTID